MRRLVCFQSRRPIWPGLAMFLVLIVLAGVRPHNMAARARQQPVVQCGISTDAYPPDTKYFFNPDYGWFDATHFAAGDPAELIDSVRRASESLGSVVTVEQELHDGLMGYKAYYWVAGGIREASAINIALGVYLDWSKRFEAWQGEPPLIFIAPLTSYAVEDLPSQYVGFVAAARDMTPLQVLTCYLGDVEVGEGDPPHFVLASENDLISFKRLENRLFTPIVETANGWKRVPWPKKMRISAATSGPRTWLFLDDYAWYLPTEE